MLFSNDDVYAIRDIFALTYEDEPSILYYLNAQYSRYGDRAVNDIRDLIDQINTKSEAIAKAEAADQALVAGHVLLLHIVQQAAALADENQQATTAVEILWVRLQVLGQFRDAAREQRDLHLGAAGIARLGRIFLDERGAALRVRRHHVSFTTGVLRPRPPHARR